MEPLIVGQLSLWAMEERGYIAIVIHHDLPIINVSAWQWRLAVSPLFILIDALVYINNLKGGLNLNETKTDGVISNSKQLRCSGNYSRSVRPDMFHKQELDDKSSSCCLIGGISTKTAQIKLLIFRCNFINLSFYSILVPLNILSC